LKPTKKFIVKSRCEVRKVTRKERGGDNIGNPVGGDQGGAVTRGRLKAHFKILGFRVKKNKGNLCFGKRHEFWGVSLLAFEGRRNRKLSCSGRGRRNAGEKK